MPYQDTWSETSKKQIQHDFYPLESIVSNFFKIIAHKFRSKKAEPRNLQEQIRIIRFLKWYLSKFFCYCCSVAQSCPTLCHPMDCSMPGFPVLYHLPGVCSNACPLNWWHHPTISSPVIPFSTCLQSFPASDSFPVSQLFAPSGQCIGASPSALILPMSIQGWFPLGLTGLIYLQSKGLSRVFSSTAARKQQFFSAQSSLWSNSQQSYMTTGKTIALTTQTFISKVMSLLFNTLSKFVIAFLPRSKYLLILYRKKRGWQMNHKYTKCSSKAMSGSKSTCWHLLAWKYQSKSSWNFLGSPVVKNLPSNAGDIGSIPGPGATKPMCCNYWAHVLQSPHATTREKPVCWN